MPSTIELNGAEKWVVGQLKKYGPSEPLLIVICKPIHIHGSIWTAMQTLADKGIARREGKNLILI